MAKYNVRLFDEERVREVEAFDAETAAELAAEQAFHDWAWETASSSYPMRIVVDGQPYRVDMEALPSFTARREVENST